MIFSTFIKNTLSDQRMTFRAATSEVQHEVVVLYLHYTFSAINLFLTYNKLKLNNRFNFKVITARKKFRV